MAKPGSVPALSGNEDQGPALMRFTIRSWQVLSGLSEVTVGNGGALCRTSFPTGSMLSEEAGCCEDRTWNRVWHSPGQVWHASMELGMGTVPGPGSVAHKPCEDRSNTH